MQQRHRLARLPAFCLAILPALFVAALIYKYGVDIPYSDEWELAPIFFKYAEGQLAFRHLFALQNEYRQFFPNLVIIFMGGATGWDVRYEMWVSFLLAALTSFNVYRLGRLTFGGGDRARTAAFLLSNLLIFSPAQSMNWQMGQQVIFFFPAACVTTCLLVARSGLGFWTRFGLCACLSTISTFSSANGVACWLVVFPALFWPTSADERSRRGRAALAWAALFVLNVALYFQDYAHPQGHPSLLTPLQHPLRGTIYFLSLLGATLSGEAAPMLFVAMFVGLLLLTLYAAALVRLRRLGAFDARSRDLITWLALGAYSILSAGIVTLARSGFGVEHALSSRYTTYTLYLAVAVIHLTALSVVSREGRVAGSRLARRAAVAGALAVIALTALASYVAVRQMRVTRTHLLQAKACLAFLNVAPDACLGEKVLENVPALRKWANRLDEMSFLRPGLLKSDRVSEFADPHATPPGAHGTFDISEAEGGSYTAEGTAALARRGEPADAVVLAYEDGSGEARVFALAEVEGAWTIYGSLRQFSPQPRVRWRKTFDAGELPPQTVALSAWAFDGETGRAHRIGDARPLRRAE